MTKTEELTTELIAVLDASPVSIDEKIKVLGVARSHLNKAFASPDMDKWRERRLQQGSVGSKKKTEKKPE